MRLLTLAISLPLLLVLTLPACRRRLPPNHAGTAAMPAPTSAPEPEPDETEPEEEKKPPPPPPPPKPASPPPSGEAGFAFGLSRKDAMNVCTTKAVWRREGQNYACTDAVEDPGFGGSPVLSFCDDRLCAIGVAIAPEATDWITWDQAFTKMRSVLVTRHGEPTTTNEQIPDDCKNAQFVSCLDSGRAQKELTWKWDGHVVILRMSKKRSSDGPSAIRFVSMPRAAGAAQPSGETSPE